MRAHDGGKVRGKSASRYLYKEVALLIPFILLEYIDFSLVV